jgi:nucleotide-binding universal stress UspA family protein
MKNPRRTVTFQSILCPVDFSPQSRKAVRYAAALAQRSGGRLVVLFVNDPLLLAAAAAVYHHRRLFVERSRAELVRFVKSIRTGPTLRKGVSCMVSEGNPGDEILRAAKRLESDLIVIGTHGLSGVSKLFFGSTTEHVLQRVTIPVLAIPPSIRTPKPHRRGTSVLTVARVVAPIDLAGEWQSDASRAADIARWLDAELVLVHVMPRIPTPPWLGPNVAMNDRRRTEKASKALKRVRTTLFSDVSSASRVLIGNPADEIARLAANGPPSLVVMGLRGTGGLWRARRGSIAYRVLTHAVTPVLALPRKRLGRRLSKRLFTTVTRALSERDQIEMAGIDALLSVARGREVTRGRRSSRRDRRRAA